MALLKRRKWLIIVGIAFLLVAGLAATKLPGRGDAEPKAKAAPQPKSVVVTTDPVTSRPIRRTVSAIGSLWGWEEVPITPKVEGTSYSRASLTLATWSSRAKYSLRLTQPTFNLPLSRPSGRRSWNSLASTWRAARSRLSHRVVAEHRPGRGSGEDRHEPRRADSEVAPAGR